MLWLSTIVMVKVDLSLELNPTQLAETTRKFVCTVLEDTASMNCFQPRQRKTSVFCHINDLRDEEFAVGMLSVSTHSNQPTLCHE